MNQYDIIGDIHAHADILQTLLEKLGYHQQNGYYQHPARKAVFLGDFIDNGRQNRRAIELVKPMVEQQAAYAILGNHEYNAICFHTYGTDGKTPLRAHSQKNIQQHQFFLREYHSHPQEQKGVIDWFKTLPLFLELDEFRAIHPCWYQPILDQMKDYLDDRDCLIQPTGSK